MTQIVDSLYGTITRTYYCMDDLIGEQTPLGEISYNYDAAHRLLSTTVDGQTPITYGYDAASRRAWMNQPTGGRFTYAYDPVGRITTLTNFEGQVTTWSYDAASRVTAARAST